MLLSAAVSARAQSPSAAPAQIFLSTAPAFAGQFPGLAGLARDGAGDIYAAADVVYNVNPVVQGEFVQLAKFSVQGNLLWSVNFASSAANAPVPAGVVSVAADAAGDVYLLEYVGGVFSAVPTELVKLDAGGNTLESVPVPMIEAPYYADIYSVAYDSSSGHVYAVGKFFDSRTQGYSMLALDYDADLVLQNSQIVADGPDFTASAVAVDTAGYVYVGGDSVNYAPSYNSTLRMLKFAPHLQGSPVYDEGFPVSPNPYLFVTGVGPDGAGGAWAGGMSISAGWGYSSLAIRRDAAGALRSQVSYATPGASYDMFVSLTADAAGDAYVLDSVYFGGGAAGKLLKFDAGGKPLWSASPALAALSDGGTPLIALDGRQDVIMEGLKTYSPPYGRQLAVAEYAPGSNGPISISFDPNPVSPRRDGVTVSTAQVLVRVVGAQGQGLAGQSVSLSAQPELASGGHSHGDSLDANAPAGSFAGGACIQQAADGTCLQAGVTCMTDANGDCQVNLSTPVYQASQFGGDVLFTATSLDSPNVASTATLTVAMPNLDLLPDTTYYDKTGGTCNHPGPNAHGFPASCSTPDDNHYVYSSPVDPNKPNSNPSLQLQMAAQAFLKATKSKMRLNDMSLPDGGGFDIFGQWDKDVSANNCKFRGHCWHRLGKSVDVENLGQLVKLEQAFSDAGNRWIYVREGNTTAYPHFQWDNQEK